MRPIVLASRIQCQQPKTDKLSLALIEDLNFFEPEGAEENVESFAGMLDDLNNGDTLPRLS